MGRIYNSTVINSPLEVVWQTIRYFHDMKWAEPVISKLQVVSDLPGDQIGAKRLLNDAFGETLLSLDDDEHSFSYTITDGPSPVDPETVSNYIATVQLRPVTDSDATFVEWEATFETTDESAVGDFCNPIYVALLTAMKKSLEG